MDILDLATSVDVGWTLVAAALVFFMQAGFAMVETGFTRAKNAGNIIMKNLMDFSLGTPIFWILGFGIIWEQMQSLLYRLQVREQQPHPWIFRCTVSLAESMVTDFRFR